jgi:hypothetical protein
MQLFYKVLMINNVHENGRCTVHEMVDSTYMRNFRAQQFGTETDRYCCVLSSVAKTGNRIFKKLIRVYNKFLDIYISVGLRR